MDSIVRRHCSTAKLSTFRKVVRATTEKSTIAKSPSMGVVVFDSKFGKHALNEF